MDRSIPFVRAGKSLAAFAAGAFLAVAAQAQFDAPDGPRDLPAFELTAVKAGRDAPFTNADLPGHVWVVDFIYTRCHDECPVLTARMKGVAKRLPKGIRILSFTVDPEFDKPPVLRKYAKKWDADLARWWFVAGPSQSAMIPLLKDGFGTAFRKDASSDCGYRTMHSARFALIAPDGKATLYRSDDADELARMESDAKALLAKTQGPTNGEALRP